MKPLYLGSKDVEFNKAKAILMKATAVGKIAQKELAKLTTFMKE